MLSEASRTSHRFVSIFVDRKANMIKKGRGEFLITLWRFTCLRSVPLVHWRDTHTMPIWRLLLFFGSESSPLPSLLIFVPRVSDLHTLGPFPTRLWTASISSQSLLSRLASLTLSRPSFLPPSLPPSNVLHNPFSCQWRQKRGSAQKKNERLPSPTIVTFPEAVLKTCLLWHTTSYGVIADIFFLHIPVWNDWRKRKTRASV